MSYLSDYHVCNLIFKLSMYCSFRTVMLLNLSRNFICLGLIGRMNCVFPQCVLQNVDIVVSSGIVEP
jgi:hypothetical protein